MGDFPPQALLRMADENANRCREGLRVAEDMARMMLRNESLTRKFRALRRSVTAQCRKTFQRKSMLGSRGPQKDPGRPSRQRDKSPRRARPEDLAGANMRRAQEALRVLEELAALGRGRASPAFRKMRFQSYSLESELDRALARSLKRGSRGL